LDPEQPADLEEFAGQFDTALCLNVLENVEDPRLTIASMRKALKPGGKFLVLVPQHPALYASIDRSLGHRRRFSQAELRSLLEQEGFRVEAVRQLNKIGMPAWWLYGKVLGRKYISKLTLKLFDKTVWIWRRVDRLLPWKGLSLIVVARKPS